MPLKVLIVGADVGTLTLALILEQAGIDFTLLESQESVPACAGGLVLHPTILPLLEQLSLRDDLLFTSQPLEQVALLDSKMGSIGGLDWSEWRLRYGAWSRFMTRIEYCNMVLEKLPEAKVLFQKAITQVSVLHNGQEYGSDDEQDNDPNHTSNEPGVDHIPLTFEGRRDSILDEIVEEKQMPASTTPPATAAAPPPPARGVTVECSDGSMYSGHILICNVGDSLQDKLAALDLDLGSDSHNSSPGASFTEGSQSKEIQYFLSGVTDTMDSQRYPLMKEDTTQLNLVLDDRSGLTWWAATLVDHRIAWQVTKRVRLSEKSAVPPRFGSPQDPSAIRSMCNHISPRMICPLGGTMSQLVEWTRTSNMACKRWERGFEPIVPAQAPPRVLFLGEAGRKTIPLFGEPGDETILDALSIAESLVSLRSKETKTVQAAIDSHHSARSQRRDLAIDESRSMDQLLRAGGPLRRLCRSVALNYTPKCMQDRMSDEKYAYRPQATFLHPVPDYGAVPPNVHSGRSRRSFGGCEKLPE
ncbi:hypothetical protein EMPS_06509 [Entomortierella parvispora]|uniref:FAD-binding domain-containing protein n=1 Tax=Entomortierella parvispora TaxID=205924 RepID=A0A9P3HCD8_9FUNG|nr:hypothetical protein EMPS_06509 [Entomortierella parvispora]